MLKKLGIIIGIILTAPSIAYGMNTAQEITVYDLIRRSVHQKGATIDPNQEFRSCLIATRIHNALLKTGSKVSEQTIATVKQEAILHVDSLSPDLFAQKRDEWLLIRNWYIAQLIRKEAHLSFSWELNNAYK